MNKLRLDAIVGAGGTLIIEDLPLPAGQKVQIDIYVDAPGNGQKSQPVAPKMKSVGDFLASGAIGIWEDRDDIDNSVAYSRKLREDIMNRVPPVDDSD